MKPHPSLSLSDVSAFRLLRHHFLDKDKSDLVTICRDICGVQAQVMSAARMALWSRDHNATQSDIKSALYETRALVKMSCMRQTLHLLPAADFSLFITALKRSRLAAVGRIMARFDVPQRDADRLNGLILDALADGPMTHGALKEHLKSKVGKRVRTWMENVWSVTRLAMAEGLICYGPDRGAQVTFVRVDQWLPQQEQIPEDEAKQTLLRRYLGAYGPATLRDFSFWSGIPMSEAKAVWQSLEDDLVAVSIDGTNAWVLRTDHKALVNAPVLNGELRLLPGFDPYVLAHASKSHLVSDLHYKQVYRNQWWISPVVLLDGRVIGVWSLARAAKVSALEVDLFQKSSKKIRARIEEEAASLGVFIESPLQVSYLVR